MQRLYSIAFLYGIAVQTKSAISFSAVKSLAGSTGNAVSGNRNPRIGFSTLQLSARKTLVKERVAGNFDPLCLSDCDPLMDFPTRNKQYASLKSDNGRNGLTHSTHGPSETTGRWSASTAATALAISTANVDSANALDGINLSSFKAGMTVENFQPVCGTSDGFYRVLQQFISTTVGPENFKEYGPLIAGGLLRVRLELCVVESFFNEAVGPFIRDNGLSWILPLHETVETFIAGGIFAIATTFILIGSTKLLTVIITYTDFLVGLPSRLFGGFAFDRAQGKPVTLDVGFGPFKTRLIGPPKESEPIEQKQLKDFSIVSILVLIVSGAVKNFGQALRLLREFMEALDAFVGRYLAVWASAYLIVKFVHFKIFPDFP